MHGYQLYIHVGQDDYGSQALIRLDTNLVLRSDGTMQDTKNAYCASIADLHETDPVKLFDAVNKCFKTTTRANAMEDAVHPIQECTGQTLALSMKISS